jgi:Flp pilus assembly protein TadG
MVLRNDSKRQSGIAATELALVLPFLVFLFAITVDFSRIFYYTITLEYAARDGAYYASNYPGLYDFSDSTTTQLTNITNAALGEASNISPTPTVTATYDSNYNGTFTSTTASQTGYVQVQVTYTFNTIMNFPGVPSSTTINRSVRMAMAPVTPG